MAELSTVYELTHPDGSRIVTGNLAAAKADPDFVGYLDPDNGLTGLDSADVREAGADLTAGDGGINYDGFRGRRPVQLAGTIWPEFTATQRVAIEEKILHVTDCLKGDALLRWTNTGLVERRLALRTQQPTRITGRRPKAWLIAMIAQDWRRLADAESSTVAAARNVPKTAHNAGTAIATPRFQLTGPLGATIKLRNLDLGLAVQFKAGFSLAAGQVLVVDLAPPYPTVQVDGVDAYDQVDYLPTSWWGLEGALGGADTAVQVDAGSGAGTWRVFWRDAWP